ncbi:heterokaryon incompatibility protein-domain-containing protein [Xylogone sp. PMI_703]|nr:heterokaryon incompatibility protein-domain-containing protein [Xylogone sp. PMI_703]
MAMSLNFGCKYCRCRRNSLFGSWVLRCARGTSTRTEISLSNRRYFSGCERQSLGMASPAVEPMSMPNIRDVRSKASSIYRKLPSIDYIRVLRLHPGGSEAPLSAELISIPFDEAKGSYEALSYTWGKDEATEQLHCEDSILWLRPNLASALRRLRLLLEPRNLWIDYLCIDQLNEEERGEQMKFMHEIYGHANQVITWIGERDETSDLVMDYIAQLDPELAILQFDDWKKSWVVTDPKAHILERDDETWTTAVDQFLSRSWFRRVWVQQEAAVCGNTTILCGDKQVTWNQIFAFSWLASLGGALTANVDRQWRLMSLEAQTSIRLVRTIQSMRKRPDGKDTLPTLLHVLNMTRRAEASFHRDRIFAVQHLAKQARGYEIMIDPVSQTDWKMVFEEFATKYLLKRGPAVISYAGRSAQKNHNFPSWVPDWTYKSYSRIMGVSSWCAGGPPRGYRIPRHRIEVGNRKILSLGGMVLETITKLSDTTLGAESEASYADIEKQAYSLIDEYGVYFTGESQVEAYMGTLFAGNQPMSQGGRSEVLQKFREWQSWLQEQGNPERMFYELTIENTGTFVDKRFGFAGDYMCLVPETSEIGDKICLIQTLQRPMVIRERGECYEFIGECYVHGIMDGEKWDPLLCERMNFC